MGIIWIVLIDIIIFILAAFNGILSYQIVKFFKFDIPFTNEMIDKGVIKAELKSQLLFTTMFGILFTFILILIACIVGAYFSGISGYIVLLIGFLAGVIGIPPTKDRYTRSLYTINGYIDAHSICMDMDKL